MGLSFFSLKDATKPLAPLLYSTIKSFATLDGVLQLEVVSKRSRKQAAKKKYNRINLMSDDHGDRRQHARAGAGVPYGVFVAGCAQRAGK